MKTLIDKKIPIKQRLCGALGGHQFYAMTPHGSVTSPCCVKCGYCVPDDGTKWPAP